MGTRYPELKLRHAVQNWAGVKNGREGAARKAEGVRAGVPDCHLPVPRAGWASLYIELKREVLRPTKTRGVRVDRTRPSPEQERWLAALTAAGILCVVCWSPEEAWQIIERYLRGEIPRESG